MVCGTYLEENCPSTNRHLLDFGEVKKLARMVCGTYFTEGFLPFKMLKLGPKIGATECPFDSGGGSNCYLGNAQMKWKLFQWVLREGFP